MPSQSEKVGADGLPSESSPIPEGSDMSTNVPSHPRKLTHAEMLGMYYRNEINREELWQLERMWANRLGELLPASALDRAKQIAKAEGIRFWTWDEEQRLPAKELIDRAEKCMADRRAAEATFRANGETE